jgi:hypothetical protein
MNGWKRYGLISYALSISLAGALSPSARAIPSFQSPDWRLPNPDRPYEMTSGTVGYEESLFSLYDLTIEIANPSQLDTPSHRSDDRRLEFDSTFDVNFEAIVSRSLEPAHPVIGNGTARVVGITRSDTNPPHTYPHPQVFDTELVSMTLHFFDTSPALDVLLRESPTLQSYGVTIREDPCPMCAAPFTHWIISSFLDLYSEVSVDGGASWHAASDLIHLEQAPDGFPPGDYNKNGIVDSSDYIVWRSTLGEIGAGLAADGDWSGKVDSGDLDVWRLNYGQTSASGSGQTAASPEPSSFTLVMLGLVLLARRIRTPSNHRSCCARVT